MKRSKPVQFTNLWILSRKLFFGIIIVSKSGDDFTIIFCISSQCVSSSEKSIIQRVKNNKSNLTTQFVFLGIFEIKKQDTSEEVKEEEGADEDKAYEVKSWIRVLIQSRTSLLRSAINSLIHDIDPSFKGTHNKESVHGLERVVKVWAVGIPMTMVFQAFFLSWVLVRV